jgi:crotonobetainyl-CoA:carnitine CoA-transferase CaiB-like acyl-CoA transferase
VDISMTDGMVGLLPVAFYWKTLTGETPRRGDNMLSHRYACYNTYETADGRHMVVGAVEGKFWQAICERLGLSEFAGHQYDDDRREEIIAVFRDTFRTKTMAQWENRWPIWTSASAACARPTKCWTFPVSRKRDGRGSARGRRPAGNHDRCPGQAEPHARIGAFRVGSFRTGYGKNIIGIGLPPGTDR